MFQVMFFYSKHKISSSTRNFMKNFNEILPAAKICRPDTEETDFLFPLVVAFSHPGLLKGCGKHCNKFSLATECLHMYVHFLTFPSKGPWSRCLQFDLCSIIFRCHFTQNWKAVISGEKWQWFNEVHGYCIEGQEMKACLNLHLLS